MHSGLVRRVQVKTRLQAAGCAHATSTAVIRDVVATSGVLGLWRGTVPSMVRASLLTASQCATYDVVKRELIAVTSAAEDSVATQLSAGAVTGLITTTVTAPADVLKTRMFAAGGEGVIASAAALMREGGVAVLFRGWLANYARLGPQTLITFLAAEQLRKLFGLSAL
jgi:solute carrier family 25 (mitochondrial uncoupling protein), member 8/9